MSWAVGYNSDHRRFIGYGVPTVCEHPHCTEEINRGLSYVCGDNHPNDRGCGMYFCDEHLGFGGYQLCKRCATYKPHYKLKPEHPEWLHHLATDESWAEWRKENAGLLTDLYPNEEKGRGL